MERRRQGAGRNLRTHHFALVGPRIASCGCMRSSFLTVFIEKIRLFKKTGKAVYTDGIDSLYAPPVFVNRAARYATTLMRFWRESYRVSSFARLMQIRLAQSKVGGLVCPHAVTAQVSIGSLGGDIYLRSHTTDVSVLMELVVSDGYDCILPFVKGRPRTIVDLGANTGLASRWMLARWPEARLVAVEPEGGNADTLRRNLEEFSGSATVLQACIGARPRKVRLQCGNGEWGFQMADAGTSDEACVDVIDMKTVLDELGHDTIDVLKCDVEGAEEELFDECADWMHKVRLAVVECHADYTGLDLLEAARAHVPEFRIAFSTGKSPWGCEIVVLARD